MGSPLEFEPPLIVQRSHSESNAEDNGQGWNQSWEDGVLLMLVIEVGYSRRHEAGGVSHGLRRRWSCRWEPQRTGFAEPSTLRRPCRRE